MFKVWHWRFLPERYFTVVRDRLLLLRVVEPRKYFLIINNMELANILKMTVYR